jgi:hypothetical protein
LQAKQDIRDAEAEIVKAETTLKLMLGQAERGRAGSAIISWPMRSYKAQPARMVAAKEAYVVRQSTLTVKELQ